MKKTFLSLFLLINIFQSGCDDKKKVLDEDTFVKILIQIHIAEAKAANAMLLADSTRFYFWNQEDSIFAAHNTDRAFYTQSYIYYSSNPKLFDKIYSRVVDSLSLRETLRKLN